MGGKGFSLFKNVRVGMRIREVSCITVNNLVAWTAGLAVPSSLKNRDLGTVFNEKGL